MRNRKIIAVVGILLILGTLVGYKIIKSRQQGGLATRQLDNETSEKEKVHYHAGFIVVDNGKKVDFGDNKFMLIKPCLVNGQEEEKNETAENIQLERAHLHDNVGDVVHVEEEGAKWSDLFTNIKYPMDYSKVTAYVNGQKVDDFQNYPIKAYDSAVIFIGSVNEKLLNQAVKADHIKEVEGKSETCGS